MRKSRIIAEALTAVLATALLSTCATNPAAPINSAGSKLLRYFDAKDQLAAELQQRLGGTTGSTTYRLISINGPAYPVGALISADNPLDLESRACVLGSAALPRPEPWAGFPSWSSHSNLDLGLAIPAYLRPVFDRAQSSLSAGIKVERISNFAINDISQVFLSREELRRVLQSGECRNALAAAEGGQAIFVRGLVYGREAIKSARGFNASLGVKVMEGETGQFHFVLDNTGAFEMTDADLTPKFAIVAQVAASPVNPDKMVPGDLDGVSFRAPSDALMARLSEAQRR